MFSITTRPIAKILGNLRFQHLLEKLSLNIESLMGIGMGSVVESSGEQAVIFWLAQHNELENQLCVFDVGANKGQFLSMAQAILSGLSVIVHAFEPSPATYLVLRQNTENFSHVVLNNFALGEKAGSFALYSDAPGSGLASLSKRRLDHFGLNFNHSEIVRVETLDQYCELNQIHHIDLLKLDVEGHELDVLKGGRKMFAQQAIDIVAFEFGGCNIDTRSYFQDFWYLFHEMGMGFIYRITPTGYLYPIIKYMEIYERFRTTNFVAAKFQLD
ncbi:MAG: FkbM family methyltransferase [Deltaproteobacteria bacterium]|nr:FkbM family methyltransferase [Deltaproteobacteria bacterium]